MVRGGGGCTAGINPNEEIEGWYWEAHHQVAKGIAVQQHQQPTNRWKIRQIVAANEQVQMNGASIRRRTALQTGQRLGFVKTHVQTCLAVRTIPMFAGVT